MKLDSVQLLYNAAAHFKACEKYPEGLIAAMQAENTGSFDAMLWAFTESAKQAELYRRFMGEDPKRILTEDEWRTIIKPGQLKQAVKMVLDAVVAGMGDGAEDEEIDEVLMELEKKTGKARA